MPFDDASVIVAVSGGADSVSLLLAMHDLLGRRKMRLQVIVAHFNHKLRGRESDEDEDFVRDLAARLGLEFVAGKGKGKLKHNLEQGARDERYRFLVKTARRYNATAVLAAHTRNDQAETFLLNLIRGSGPDGLGAMRSRRILDSGIDLVRPLLSWATRSDTEAYVGEVGLAYRTDRMNEDRRFTRVRIRRDVLPMLAEINPRIVETLARTSELLQDLGVREPSAVLAGSVCDLGTLRKLEPSELYRELRCWLARVRGDLRGINLKHIQAVARLIHSPKSGKTVEIPGGGRVMRDQGRLVYSNIKVEK